jgi:hypothetical protein
MAKLIYKSFETSVFRKSWELESRTNPAIGLPKNAIWRYGKF